MIYERYHTGYERYEQFYERYHTDYERYEHFYERYQSPMKKDLTLRIRGGQGLFNYRTV